MIHGTLSKYINCERVNEMFIKTYKRYVIWDKVCFSFLTNSYCHKEREDDEDNASHLFLLLSSILVYQFRWYIL